MIGDEVPSDETGTHDFDFSIDFSFDFDLRSDFSLLILGWF